MYSKTQMKVAHEQILERASSISHPNGWQTIIGLGKFRTFLKSSFVITTWESYLFSG